MPLKGIRLQDVVCGFKTRQLELSGLSETIQSNMQLRSLDFRATFMTSPVLRAFLAGCANHPTLQVIGLPDVGEDGVDTIMESLPSLACESMRLFVNSIFIFDDGKYSRHRLPQTRSLEKNIRGCIHHPTLRSLRFTGEDNTACLDMIIRVLPSLPFSKISFTRSFSTTLESPRAIDLASAIRRQTTLYHLNFEFLIAPRRPLVLPRNITELLERNQALAGVQPLGSHTVASLGRAFGKLASMSSPVVKLSPIFDLLRSLYVPKVLEERTSS